MPSVLKKLMIYLAVMAMGSAQLFGVQAGYICDCTGQRSTVASCEPAACHPGGPLNSDHQACAPKMVSHQETQQSQQQQQQDHQHLELREGLDLTGMPSMASLSLPVVCDLPPSFQLADIAWEQASPFISESYAVPLDHLGPPTALVVAKTMVMLV